MPLRIVSDSEKFTVVVIALVVYGLVAFLALPIDDLTNLFALPAAALVIIAAFVSRTFRGEGEPVTPPRPWWRATATARSGYAVAAVFAVQAIAALAAPIYPTSVASIAVTAGVPLGLAAWFIHSSVRLRAAAG